MTGREPFTALVVAHRHEDRLDACLEALAFADERLLVALRDVPELERLASRHGVRHLRRPFAPIVERVWTGVIPLLATDWVLLVDPDEVVSPALARALESSMETMASDVGIVRVPWRFHFRGRPLRTTVWGRSDQTKRVLVHRGRVHFHPDVHRGLELRSGFREIHVGEPGRSVLEHHWCESYGEFFAKHRRYLRHEGPARFRRGLRFSWFGMAGRTLVELGRNLVRHRGLLGGPTGVSLSLLKTWYEARAWWELRRYQAEQGGGDA